MTDAPRLRGLYAITDSTLIADSALLASVEAAIDGGARCIQYRDKRPDAALREHLARALNTACQARGVPLIINDDLALAARIGAAGVHLGREDGALSAARATLGARAIIGVSCYDELERARAAVAGGADYIAFGAVYPTAIKPQAVRASLELLRAARAEFRCPIVAIGGIRADNAAPLLAAGVDMLAVISAVFGEPDVRAAAARFAALFTTPTPEHCP